MYLSCMTKKNRPVSRSALYIRMPAELMQALKLAAERRGETISTIIRELVREYLK